MNQILVTKKLYITPELKRKKKVYKVNFIVSVFLLIILMSVYIYATYDRDKAEAMSQEILASAEAEQSDNTVADSNVLIAILNDTTDDGTTSTPVLSTTSQSSKTKQQSESGYTYIIDGKITIPTLGIEYPILDGESDSEEETEELLKMSPVKFHGPEINTVGNYCIVGHNYRNSRFFSKVPTLENGDIIQITDYSDNTTVEYVVYDKYTVDPSDVSCTSQNTDGKREITLITCTDDSSARWIIKATEA